MSKNRQRHSRPPPPDFFTSYKAKIEVESYASINQILLIQQLKALPWPRRHLITLIAHCEWAIRRIGTSIHCTSGIPFDVLKYSINPQGFSPSQKTQVKALENTKRRYALSHSSEGGHKSLAKYLNRWRTWVYAGLLFKVDCVEDVIKSIADSVLKISLNWTQEQSGACNTRNSRTDHGLQAFILLHPPLCTGWG